MGCDCRGMTEGFLLQSFFQGPAEVLHEREPLLGENPGRGLCRKSTGDAGKLIIPSRTNIMDLDRESKNRKTLIQLNISMMGQQSFIPRIRMMRSAAST